jgi:hypothetical protein
LQAPITTGTIRPAELKLEKRTPYNGHQPSLPSALKQFSAHYRSLVLEAKGMSSP